MAREDPGALRCLCLGTDRIRHHRLPREAGLPRPQGLSRQPARALASEDGGWTLLLAPLTSSLGWPEACGPCAGSRGWTHSLRITLGEGGAVGPPRGRALSKADHPLNGSPFNACRTWGQECHCPYGQGGKGSPRMPGPVLAELGRAALLHVPSFQAGGGAGRWGPLVAVRLRELPWCPLSPRGTGAWTWGSGSRWEAALDPAHSWGEQGGRREAQDRGFREEGLVLMPRPGIEVLAAMGPPLHSPPPSRVPRPII